MTNDLGWHESQIKNDDSTLEDMSYGDWGFTGMEWKGQDYLDSGLQDGVLTEDYKALTAYDGQAGIMKIEPVSLKQDFAYWTSAYIKEKLSYPQIQRVPVTNISIKPHQISFDFFDTSEGKIGISNATEKHMEVEGDIYVTELIYYYWDHYNSQESGKPGDHTSGIRSMKRNRQAVDTIMSSIRDKGVDKTNREIDKAIDKSRDDSQLSFTGANQYNKLGIDYITANFEETQTFIDFRNTFLLTFSGWVCKFTSQTFGSFYGVFTDISYNIDDGYSDAKWHFKIEEAIFTDDYTPDKNANNDSNSVDPSKISADGSQTDSGDISK